MPGLYKVQFDAVGGGVVLLRLSRNKRDGQVIPQAMTAEAEELEELVTLSASDVFREMALGSLIGMDTFKVLSP